MREDNHVLAIPGHWTSSLPSPQFFFPSHLYHLYKHAPDVLHLNISSAHVRYWQFNSSSPLGQSRLSSQRRKSAMHPSAPHLNFFAGQVKFLHSESASSIPSEQSFAISQTSLSFEIHFPEVHRNSFAEQVWFAQFSSSSPCKQSFFMSQTLDFPIHFPELHLNFGAKVSSQIRCVQLVGSSLPSRQSFASLHMLNSDMHCPDAHVNWEERHAANGAALITK